MEDKRKTCAVCAWRANCKKRFSLGDGAALHCPDFVFDVSLKKDKAKKKKGEKNNRDK